MFRRAHDDHYKDLSLDLRDEVDWQVKTIRELDYPLDASVAAADSCSGLLAVASKGRIYLFGRPGVECSIPVPDYSKLKILQFALPVYKLIGVDVHDRLHVWDLTTIGKPRLLTSIRFDPVVALAVSPSHTHAFIALRSGRIATFDLICHCKSPYVIPNLWDVYMEKMGGMRFVEKVDPTSRVPIDIIIHPRDLNLLIIAYHGGVALYNLTQRSTIGVYEYTLPPGAPGVAGYGHPAILTHRSPAVTAISIHPDGFTFVVGYNDGSLAFWAIEDQDEPYLVRSLQEIDINVVNHDKLNEPLGNKQEFPAIEMIFKLAWSTYTDSGPVPQGYSTLTILGGLEGDQPSGLTVELLPPFVPPPTSPRAGSHSMPPQARQALRKLATPVEIYVYGTDLVNDFILFSNGNPHFLGNADPRAIFITFQPIELPTSSRAFQFPPPTFSAQAMGAEQSGADQGEQTASPSDDPVEELNDLLKDLTVTSEPNVLGLPPRLSGIASGITDGQVYALPRPVYEELARPQQERDASTEFPLSGGFAWSDEAHGSESRLAKYQTNRILISAHRKLQVHFHDISSQLLVGIKPTPISCNFPNPIPDLIIDLTTLNLDPALDRRCRSLEGDYNQIVFTKLATESLEVVIGLQNGSVYLYRLDSPVNANQHVDDVDFELELLDAPVASKSRYKPYFLLSAGDAPTSTCAIADIGFLAVAFLDGSIWVVDLRVPRIILRFKESARKHRLLHRHSGMPDVVTALNWTICPLPSDAQPRIRLIAARTSGECDVFTVQNKMGAYTMDTEPVTLDTVARPLQDGAFMINSATGSPQKANSSNLSASIQNRNMDDRYLFIVVGSKEAKCFAGLDDDHRLGKAEWNAKYGEAETCQIVEKGAARSLVIITSLRVVLAYSLPNLEHLHTVHLPQDSSSRVSVDITGDFISWIQDSKHNVVDKAIYGTLFGLQRLSALPDIDLQSTRPVIPPQPQPIATGAMETVGSWLGLNKTITGEQVDMLLAGPDRPLPKPKPEPRTGTPETPSRSTTPNAAGTYASNLARQATAAKTSLFDRLNSAVDQRGQMLGSLEESFNSLQQGSANMVNQAKRMAAEQSGRKWLGM